MGVPPMSITGILPVSLPLPLLFAKEEAEKTNTGETPVRLMGKMPMLHKDARSAI
jgi:hypothetical protein